jgi:hypothetical protein
MNVREGQLSLSLNQRTNMATKKKTSYREQKEKDNKIVEGVFRFHEVPGGTLNFVFRMYKGDPIKRYTLVDGQRYSLPLGVVKHLNKNGWYPVHAYKMTESGRPDVHVGKKFQRFTFESTQFIDITNEDDLATMGTPALEEVVIMDQKSIK